MHFDRVRKDMLSDDEIWSIYDNVRFGSRPKNLDIGNAVQYMWWWPNWNWDMSAVNWSNIYIGGLWFWAKSTHEWWCWDVRDGVYVMEWWTNRIVTRSQNVCSWTSLILFSRISVLFRQLKSSMWAIPNRPQLEMFNGELAYFCSFLLPSYFESNELAYSEPVNHRTLIQRGTH